ncbi:MAG: T9SS type A sorting domain-containing protein [Sphingobacteriales bacterium]|nr:T9SS type A sorting domain-containing protein [Sphingobacteriales bacterium]
MRRILPILSFILLIATQSQAQSARIAPSIAIGDPIIKLYPNPATAYITFDLQNGYEKGLSLQVYSFLGKKMFESQNLPQKLTIDLTEFNRGLYMYHLMDATGKIIRSGKFQVTK